jgi:adenylate cyclase
VPVPLYVHADVIVVLDLSRNPMLEVPLDFIQACATLRELRLSNMAMKKVPQSIRQCGTLNRLDLTCNRLGDLDESGLEQLPGLQMLKLENNRLERLPWFFPRMRALRALNISNNKFTHIPAVVCEMTGLVDLDISFNSIAELPEEIGQLANLEQLIMVGNNIAAFPVECAGLKCLRVLDCRRNIISDLSMVATLPALETLRADHNLIHALQLLVGPAMTTLELPRNDVTQLILLSTPSPYPFALTTLDLSHAKLRSLAADTFAPFVVLETLKLDYNAFRSLPEHVGELARLTHLSVSNNQLDALPASIGKLRRLETLDVNSNSLRELPSTLWNCASLMHINATSNLLEVWNDPPPVAPEYTGDGGSSPASSSVRALVPGGADMLAGRKGSVTGLGRGLPPLTYSLERLYLGENKFTDDILRPLVLLRELRVLNLSFNDIQEMPPTFFKTLTKLEELYLSGNKLSAIPTEDLHRLIRLSVLFLNGNRLQTLPTELSKVQSLTVIDVGSNLLKYNINNWEYDWNW